MSRNAVVYRVIRHLQYSFVYCLTDMSFSQEQRVAPCLPDMLPPDFFLWGYLKGNVYKNNLHTRGKLKNTLRQRLPASVYRCSTKWPQT
jgi:hypothetical protein